MGKRGTRLDMASQVEFGMEFGDFNASKLYEYQLINKNKKREMDDKHKAGS